MVLKGENFFSPILGSILTSVEAYILYRCYLDRGRTVLLRSNVLPASENILLDIIQDNFIIEWNNQ